jgi:hypothetical protein
MQQSKLSGIIDKIFGSKMSERDSQSLAQTRFLLDERIDNDKIKKINLTKQVTAKY